MFNQEFKDYLGRDWLDTKVCSKEEFYSFCKRNSTLFCKSPDGMFGKGIDIIHLANVSDLDRFYDTCKKNKILLEEVLEQDCELAAFNNTAVNTIRVVTLICADDSVSIMAAVIRLSRKGKFADNFLHDGIASLIDVETGIVNTTGVDRKWNRYTIHPDSRKPIVGFQIPRWFEVVDMVKKAARVHPEVRYVGWDVTIKSSGEIVLIEGNPGADPDVTLIEDQVGKWPLYEPLLFEIESCKELSESIMKKITIIGDITSDRPLLNAAYDRKTDAYDFSPVFGKVKKLFEESDYVVGNFETVCAGDKNGFQNQYLLCNSPDELIQAMVKGGVNCVTTAYYHCLDHGIEGIVRTINEFVCN